MSARLLHTLRRALAPLPAAVLVMLALTGVPGAQAAPEKAAGGIRFTYTDANAAAVYWAGDFNGSPHFRQNFAVARLEAPHFEHSFSWIGAAIAATQMQTTHRDIKSGLLSVGV
mgnify:CR=1 FL=1